MILFSWSIAFRNSRRIIRKKKKNQVSHRGQALRKLMAELPEWLDK
jgi:XTP/dITP diphosphohydrolase